MADRMVKRWRTSGNQVEQEFYPEAQEYCQAWQTEEEVDVED